MVYPHMRVGCDLLVLGRLGSGEKGGEAGGVEREATGGLDEKLGIMGEDEGSTLQVWTKREKNEREEAVFVRGAFVEQKKQV